MAHLNLKRFEVDDKEYERIIRDVGRNGVEVVEHKVGSRRSLYVHGMFCATQLLTPEFDVGDLTQKEFVSFLGQFKKQLYSALTDESLLFLDVDFKGVSRDKDIGQWNKLPIGSEFWNLDLMSAYWQIGYKLGYVTESFFKKYMNDDKYKKAKRLCYSFLARQNKRLYRNQTHGDFEVVCCTDAENKVYENVRNYLYGTMQQALSGVDWYSYNIDGVYCGYKELYIIRDRLTELGFETKATRCVKLSETEMKYGSRPRTF